MVIKLVGLRFTQINLTHTNTPFGFRVNSNITGAYGIRTHDLHNANVARSQLRQCPKTRDRKRILPTRQYICYHISYTKSTFFFQFPAVVFCGDYFFVRNEFRAARTIDIPCIHKQNNADYDSDTDDQMSRIAVCQIYRRKRGILRCIIYGVSPNPLCRYFPVSVSSSRYIFGSAQRQGDT